MIGEVTVTKVFKDGRREVVIKKDRNMITDGMGIALINLFCSNPLNPRNRVSNFKIGYFQVGASSIISDSVSTEVFDSWNGGLIDAIGNNFYELSAAFDASAYGDSTTLEAVKRKILTVTNPFADADELSYTYKDVDLIRFENDPVANVNENEGSIRVKINVDEEAAVGQTIREFGLFITNPEGHFGRDKPALAAYKTLYNPIEKTADFSLDIDWAILFNEVDSELGSHTKVKFKPKVVKDYQNREVIYATFLDASASERVYIETPVPVEEDTLIGFSLSSDDGAVNNVHYKIDASALSGVTIARNTNSTYIDISGSQKIGYNPTAGSDQYETKRLYLTLSSVKGPRGIVSKETDYLSDQFLVNLLPRQSSNFSQSRIVKDSDSGGTLSISANVLHGTTFQNQTTVNYDVYVSLSAAPTVTLASSSIVINVPRNTTGGATSSITYTGTGDVSAAIVNNLLSGTPTNHYEANLNRFADSNDFSIPRLFSSVELDATILSSYWSDLIDPQPGGFYQTNYSWFLPGMKSWFAGDKTLKTYGNVFDYNSYKAKPTRDVLLSHAVSSQDAPDLMQDSTLLYQPCALYLWPTQSAGTSSIPAYASRVERSYENSEETVREGAVGGSDQKLKFSADTSTITFSVYFKDFDPVVNSGATINRAPVVALSIHSLGFDDIESNYAADYSNVSKTATFSWNETTGGLEVSSVSGEGAWANTILDTIPATSDAGVMSGTADDDTKFGYKDRWASPDSKWYRAYITTSAPADFTNSGYYAGFTKDGSGATSQYFIYPTVDIDGNLSALAGEKDGKFTRGSTAPVELSGSVIAWAQWEYPDQPGPPQIYTPNEDTEGTPLGGIYAASGTPGYSFITFPVT